MRKNFYPLVTIIIPVYNGSNFLKEAIESALNQSYKNLEIIVINDGSTDDGQTEKIALSFGKKIIYQKKENGGTSSALNLGISLMQGDYFSWLSHDDMYHKDKISSQVNILRKLNNKNTIIMSDLEGINEKRKLIYRTNYKEHIDEYPPRANSNLHPIIYNQTHGCTLLIPKKCFEIVGLFDEKQIVAQDFEFFYRAFSKFPHLLIPKILVTARDSSNRQGKTKKYLCNVEYSNLYIKIIENLTDEEILQLAPDKGTFLSDMRNFFITSEYSIALEYLEQISFSNLQISSYDLIGNKFNGHNLHINLRIKGIDSKQVVLYKESKDRHTHRYNFLKNNATKKFIMSKYFLETDIIHFHLIHNILDLNYLPIISRLKPTIITLHDPFFLGGHCVHHFDCENWKIHCKDCPYLNELFPIQSDYSALNFDLKKHAIQNSKISAIVASKWMENKVKQSPIWHGKKIYFLPFGVDQEIFKPNNKLDTRKKLKFPVDSKIIFFRSDNSPYKGLDIIKDALTNLEPKDDIILLTVGERGLLKEFKKTFKIIEYGWINDDLLLSNLYQACDIFLMPSKQETFGMMAIEAMSCGKTVLSVQGLGTALPEIINSPNCGLAINSRDFANTLQDLLVNPIELNKRNVNSLKYAKENYSLEVYLTRLISIYKEIFNEHDYDSSSSLVLSQLRKYLIEEPQKEFDIEENLLQSNLIFKVKKFTKKILRKTPYNFQEFMIPVLKYSLKKFQIVVKRIKK